MDVGFYIDKSGKASDYFLTYYMKANTKSNLKLEDDLFKLAVKELKKITIWEPGEVRGQKVNSENSVRVYF